jgi:alkylation response protein AidB-like acyl-CoA dehydrogenase
VRFALSAEQQQFAATLHQHLDHEPKTLAKLGVTTLATESPIDLAVAFEELGHHAIPGPLAASIAAVPTLLAELDDERWLPSLTSGELTATLTPHENADLVFTVDDDTLCLNGTVLQTGPEVRRAAGKAFDLGTLANAAQLLGAGRAMLELTVAYAKTRTQFGRPIGAFQAVRHQLADVHVALELARPLVFAAAITLAKRDISAAKLAAGEAAYRSARTALQLHGAIGYTLEYDLSRWLTTVRALRAAWGTPAEHRSRILADLCHPVAPGGTS